MRRRSPGNDTVLLKVKTLAGKGDWLRDSKRMELAKNPMSRCLSPFPAGHTVLVWRVAIRGTGTELELLVFRGNIGDSARSQSPSLRLDKQATSYRIPEQRPRERSPKAAMAALKLLWPVESPVPPGTISSVRQKTLSYPYLHTGSFLTNNLNDTLQLVLFLFWQMCKRCYHWRYYDIERSQING